MGLPADIEGELVRLARASLDSYAAHPRIAAFWVRERFAAWFAATEPRRRAGISEVKAEVSGVMVFDAPAGPFTLTARADASTSPRMHSSSRITKPALRRVIRKWSLALHRSCRWRLQSRSTAIWVSRRSPSVLLRRCDTSALRAAEPPGAAHDVKCGDVAELATKALDGLKQLVARFDDVRTPYRPLRRARFGYDYDDCAHLARVAEWSSGASLSEEG